METSLARRPNRTVAVRAPSAIASYAPPPAVVPRTRLTSGDAVRIGLFVAAIGVPLAGIVISSAGG